MKYFVVLSTLFSILCSSVSLATEVIKTNSDFVALVQKAATGDFSYDIELETDLDFSVSELASVAASLPLGKDDYDNYYSYSGTFDGKGHTIKNLRIADDGNMDSSVGLIGEIGSAVIRNLTIDKTCSFAGSFVGGVCGFVWGNITLYNVEVNAMIKPKGMGGGLVAGFVGDDVSVDVQECVFGGSIIVESFDRISYVGGLIGSFEWRENCEIRIEHNLVQVRGAFSVNSNDDCYVGGLFGMVDGKHSTGVISDNILQFDAEVEHGDDSSLMAFGGCIGELRAEDSSCTMENNVVEGNYSFFISGDTYIGGFIGHFSDSPKLKLLMINNTNHADLNTIPMEISYNSWNIGGFIGRVFPNNCSVTLISNTNYGRLNIKGEEYGTVYSGGFIGIFDRSNQDNPDNHLMMVNNQNYGDCLVGAKLGEDGISFCYGGIVGMMEQDVYAKLLNNINKGSIEGSYEGSKAILGGVFGSFDAYFTSIIRGNINYGNIKMSLTHNILYINWDFHVASIIGDYTSWNVATIKDNENFGNISIDTEEDTPNGHTIVCGLVYGANDIVLENCVNKGDVKGNRVYGITNQCTNCSNIVSMGSVNGKDYAYQFYDLNERTSNIFGMKDSCVSCDDSVSLIEKNGDYYHTVKDNSRVDTLLNNEAKSKQNFDWDTNLDLVIPDIVFVHIEKPFDLYVFPYAGKTLEDEPEIPAEVFKYHLFAKGSNPSTSEEYTKATTINKNVVLVPYFKVTINGGVSGTYFVEANTGNLVENVPSLKEYMGDKRFAVGDSEHHNMLSDQATITCDMDIIVINRNEVWIEVDESVSFDVNDVNRSEIAQTISKMTGIDVSEILVEFEADEHGVAKRVIIILDDLDKCKKAAEAVNNYIDCESSDILCHGRAHEDGHSSASPSEFSLSARNYVRCALILLLVFVFTNNM